MVIFSSQKEAKRVIQASIDTNDKAVIKALLTIHSLQTVDEKASRAAVKLNGVGFGKFDAEILTSFVDRYQEVGNLTTKQMQVARKCVRRYWKQLAVYSGGLRIKTIQM